MPSKYKLVYFKGAGRADMARFLFAQVAVEYEDCRVTLDEFKVMKGDTKKFPFGQLPVLFVDDRPPIPQSRVIERYLARQFGMFGKDDEETILIDVTYECVQDILLPLSRIFYEKDEAKKAEMVEDFLSKSSVPIFTAMCNTLKKNQEGKGYFVGNEMTLADMAVFTMTKAIFMMFPDLAEKYPELKEFDTRMRAEPKIAAWLAKDSGH